MKRYCVISLDEPESFEYTVQMFDRKELAVLKRDALRGQGKEAELFVQE